MDEVLDSCAVDYPKLSLKIRNFLKDVVHKGCTHEGNLLIIHILLALKAIEIRIYLCLGSANIANTNKKLFEVTINDCLLRIITYHILMVINAFLK